MFGLFSALYSSLAYTSGSFEEVFRKEGLTLDDLLDEEGVVNEFKRMNTKLHEFISNGQVDKLIEYVTVEPTDPNDKKHSYKYPYVSAELLSCENNLILNTFFPIPEPARSRKSTLSINEDRDIDRREEDTPEIVNHQRDDLSPTGPVEHIAQPGDVTPTLKNELTEENLKFVKEEKTTEEEVKTDDDKEKEKKTDADEEEKKDPEEVKKPASGSDEGDDNNDMVKIGDEANEEMMKRDESHENGDEELSRTVELPMLNKLFKFVDTTEPLNHTLAGYFFKVVNNLFNKRTTELVDYLFQYEDGKHIKNLARHMESRSIAELLAKILSFEASTFNENKFIDKRCKILEDELILSLLSSSSDPECISNVGYVVQDFIQKLHQTNGGREIFEKALCDDGVLNFIFSGLVNKSSQILINATTVILTTIAGHFINPSGDRGDENSRDGSENMGSPTSSGEERFVEKYEKYMADMTKRLEEDAPVQAKLKVLEVLRHGILLRNSKLLQTIALKKVLGAILPLLTKHQWCNFLHYQIEKIIMAVLESGSEPLRRSLFKDGKLLEVLQGGVVDPLHVFETTNKTRRGYLGYITKLGNVLRKLETSDSLIGEEIKQNGEKWTAFIKEYLEPSNDNDSRDFALKEKEVSQDDEPDTKAPFVFKLIKGTQLANMTTGSQGGQRGGASSNPPRYNQQDNDDEDDEENGRGDDDEEPEDDEDDDVHNTGGKHTFTLHQGGQVSKRGDDNSDEEDDKDYRRQPAEHEEEGHETKRGEAEGGEEEPGFDQHNFWKTSHLGNQEWLSDYQ